MFVNDHEDNSPTPIAVWWKTHVHPPVNPAVDIAALEAETLSKWQTQDLKHFLLFIQLCWKNIEIIKLKSFLDCLDKESLGFSA